MRSTYAIQPEDAEGCHQDEAAATQFGVYDTTNDGRHGAAGASLVKAFPTRPAAQSFMVSLCSCQNCDWRGVESDLNGLPEAGIFDRVGAGEIMPAGECPECGAVAHYNVNPHGVAQLSGQDWQMLLDALEILQPDSDEAQRRRARLYAEIMPLAALSALAEREGH